MKMWNASTLSLLFALLTGVAVGQPAGIVIDRVVAVLGREAILHSEVTARSEQARQNGSIVDRESTCGELEDLLFEKLLIEQGRIDSVVVDDVQVDAELDRRIRYFASQLGGEVKLEEFYGKTIAEIRAEFREQVQDQLMVQTMQQKLTSDVRITPREVQRFFNRIPHDSIPLINAEVEYAMVLREPKPSTEEERRVRRKIEEFRESVLKGEKDMCTVAILYSEDPGSAKECGELGMVPVGTMVPEFDAVAMSLKEGEVSQVFKTQYGYHFMQMVERRGEHYNARHVLMRPQVGSAELQLDRVLLDSLARSIRAGEAPFAEVAAKYSDDEESKGTNGVVIEPVNNTARWDMGALDQQAFFVLDKLKEGEVSDPQLVVMPDGSKAYRILQLILRTEPHRANLKEDYRMIQQAAEGEERSKAVDTWVKDRIGGTYVRVNEEYATCPFQQDWTKKTATGN
ncbi:MAG: peptidylprolyl isomerase [Flavobacteriales bacterium]|jgi:peptidyl-prolyl cis-trans isomerase SurA|nr:peptidylprolyl isomerase [Flavobacteriales bacterium]HQW06361.1 peptidylprolyl isomerase [Flavobacteriales bacterium]